MPRLLTAEEGSRIYSGMPLKDLRHIFLQATLRETPSTTPARPTGRLEMEENKPTSTASAPSGSTSTADQENLIQTRERLSLHLHDFAYRRCCPNPSSWAQAWASTVIGPSWKNWDMPSGNPLQTGLNKLVENACCMQTLPEQRMQQASSAPPAPTGEKTGEKGSYRSESSSNIRSRILESFYKMTDDDQTYVLTRITSMSNLFGRYDEVTKKAAASNLRYAFPQYFAAPAETSAPASEEISQIPPSAPLVIGAYKFKPSTVLEILPNQNGTLTLVLRSAAPTER